MSPECGLMEVMGGILGQAAESVPFSIRGVRESFMSGGQWLFWVCFLGPTLVLLGSALWWWSRQRQEMQRRLVNDPEALFEGLLRVVKLAEEDKKLLREAARAARLRHPAMSLLSPELLDVSRRVWLAENGGKEGVKEKAGRIDAISAALYDQVTPARARQIKEVY